MRHTLRNGILMASVVVAGPLGLSACGTSTDTPEGAVDAFYSAIADRDWEAACSLLDPTWSSRINYDRPQSCEAWMADEMFASADLMDGFEVDPAAIHVEGRTAEFEEGVVKVPSDDGYEDDFLDEELVETSAGWIFTRGESDEYDE